MKLTQILDRMFPARVCRREGHEPVGYESIGPHYNNPERGEYGGVFYGLRYVVRCRRCGRSV